MRRRPSFYIYMPVFAPQIRFACTNITGYNDHKLLIAKSEEVNYLMAVKICPQVYQVGGSNLSHPDDCCIYLVESEQECALIDAGAGKGTERVLGNIANNEEKPSDVLPEESVESVSPESTQITVTEATETDTVEEDIDSEQTLDNSETNEESNELVSSGPKNIPAHRMYFEDRRRKKKKR
jgi:hypothetical protein